MALLIRDKSTCHYAQISLGEVMLRLDPGEGRIRTARRFAAWEGGGEYNTSRGLRKCFGLRTAVCTALVDHEVGHFLEDFIRQGGVDTALVKWREDDGIGRTVRHGLDFTERGFGVRGAVGVPDRMMENAAELWKWLEEGACFYVCGDASRMAKDADEALHRIVQQAGGKSADEAVTYIEDMKKTRRYRKDVY